MRKLTRSLLATTAVAGLLAIPVAGAGAADTNVSMSLTSTAGTVSVTAPVTTGANGNTVDSIFLGEVSAGTTQVAAALSNQLGDVTVSDTTTGLLRTSTTTVDTGLAGGEGFCQGSIDADGGVTCSGDANTTISAANVLYNFGTPTASGNGSTGAVIAPVSGALNAPTTQLVFTAAVPGDYTMTWSPSFSVNLLGTELAGDYYGVITHSVTGTTVGL